ncbi:histidinol-phosphate transaminase [Peptostreptococcus faecalis]|uniref:histidinol-phosphate transaminase n=1 Tax=Peptostreptococcus faecalis TaxID=2045015 RepID=UPI000C7AD2C4|nr:histidinol-phosphate transaminase [Peptostreptococcus faecalis]
MSRFINEELKNIPPYVPGEQPRDIDNWIKLNTNENPYEYSDSFISNVTDEIKNLRLYNDPKCTRLYETLSNTFKISSDMVYAGNGSDEVLAFCMMAYGKNGVAFPNITYSFYSNMSNVARVKHRKVPLMDDLSVNINDYKDLSETIILANPNAPTGLALSIDKIKELLEQNKNRLVIIDEAYVDFGAESSVCLLNQYDNLLVVGTMSKSRSLAGTRVGYALGNSELINDLNTIKYNFNPYNVNTLSQTIARKVFENKKDFQKSVDKIISTRERISKELIDLGFDLTDSKANFIFAKCPNDKLGEYFYEELKSKKILVRYWNKPFIDKYIRISIGTDQEMDKLIEALKDII